MSLAELETPGGLAIPRWMHQPAGIAKPGHHEAVELAENCGLNLDPLQVVALGLAMAEDSDGMWAADIFDWLIARQNGKNETAIVRELFGLVILGETIVHSAHHFSTAKRSYKRLWGLIQKNADVANRVIAKHQSAMGGFNIEFANGGIIHFLARGSAGAGRGFDAINLLILDEAQELKDEMLGDVMPVVSAVPNHQTWQFGTAPDEGQFFWQRKRYRGRRGLDPRTGYVEVAAEPDADLDDPEQWRQANPALLYGRITEDTIRGERGNMADETFARERMSISPEILDGSLLPGWQDCCSPEVTCEATVFALDCDPDRTHGSIVAANSDTVEVVEYRPGVGWLVARAEELSVKYGKQFAIDKTGPAAALIPELERRYVRVVAVSGTDIPRACGHLYDAVVNSRIRVRTNPDLNRAVELAAVRTAGDAWAWRRKTSQADISLLVAVTLGFWAAQNSAGPSSYWSASEL